MYKIHLSKSFMKDLKRIDIRQQELLLLQLKKDFENNENPRSNGKALKGKLKSFWRYRYGDYRVIISINDTELVVLALAVGHRRDIYK